MVLIWFIFSMGRTVGLGRIWSFTCILGFRSLVARLTPFKRESEQRGRIFWQRKVWISAPRWWDRKCEGRNEKCDFLARESVNSQQLCKFLAWESVNSSPILARQWWRHFRLSLFLSLSLSLSLSLYLSLSHRAYLMQYLPHAQYRKRFRASYIVREIHSVRERERRKWRHHCRAKIGDEFTLPFAKNSHNWRCVYTFPWQKLALFVSPFTLPVSPFTERSPLWRWNSQWVHTVRCQKIFAIFVPTLSNGASRATSDRKPKTNDQILPSPIIGSAEALPILCVRYFRWERERERYRQRRKWRHHCRAKIGDEFTLSLAKTSHNWRWAYTFPCQNIALFVSPFTLPVSPFAEKSPWWRWNSQWVQTFHCQKFFRPQALFPLFQMARAARRIENPR